VDSESFPRSGIEQSIRARFEKTVCDGPGRLAIRTPDEHLTYAAPNKRPDRVATRLLAIRASGPEPMAVLAEPGAPP
jgi:non-ribosomal peptide synthetase component F